MSRGIYHDELTVHAIGHATVTGDTVSEILDFESPFQTTGEESAEGGDQRGECCENEDMKLNRSDGDGIWNRE